MKGGIALVLSVAAIAAVLGCGGGSDNTGSGADSSEGTAAVREIQAEDQQRAEAMVLQLSDLPADWRGSPHEEGSDEEKEAFYDCLGIDLSELTILGEADSQDFSMGEDSEVQSSSTIFKTDVEAQDAVEKYLAGFVGLEAAGCFKDFFEEQIKKNAEEGVSYKVGDVRVGELNVGQPTGVEETRAVQVELPVEVEGFSVSFFLDAVVMRQGDAVTEVTTTDQSSSLDTDLRDQLVQVVASRMSGGSAPSGSSDSFQFQAGGAEQWASVWCQIDGSMTRDDVINLMGPPSEEFDASEGQPQSQWDAGSFGYTVFYDPTGHVQEAYVNPLEVKRADAPFDCELDRHF